MDRNRLLQEDAVVCALHTKDACVRWHYASVVFGFARWAWQRSAAGAVAGLRCGGGAAAREDAARRRRHVARKLIRHYEATVREAMRALGGVRGRRARTPDPVRHTFRRVRSVGAFVVID